MAKKPLWRRLKYKNIAIALAVMLIIILIICRGCSSSDKEKDESDKKTTTSQSDKKKPTNDKDNNKDNEDDKKPSVQLSTETLYDDYKYKTVDNEKTLVLGDLILINGDYAYKGGEPEDLISSYDYRLNDDGEKIMSIKDANVTAKEVVLENLNAMLNDFYKAKGIKDVMLVSGHRTEDYQKELYEADLKKTGLEYSTLVEKPGHSEHHSGYAVDFQLDQENYPFFSGEGDYKWVLENCHKYGFILRYNPDKASITGIDGETWHFRYVGAPHAQLIYNSDLCLEEYILSISQYSIDEPLYVDNVDTGDRYAIYYVPMDKSKESTNVAVPVYEDGSDYHYTISGNNCDGFIVTVDITAGKVKAE